MMSASSKTNRYRVSAAIGATVLVLLTGAATAQIHPFFPHFELVGIDGKIYRLDDFRGSVTMVNFFFPT